MRVLTASLVVLSVALFQCKDEGSGNGGGAASGAAAGASTGGTDPAGGTSGAGTVPEFDAGACEHPAVETSCADGWCRIPAGCFVMGSPPTEAGRGAFTEEQAAVTLTRGFEIGEREVSQQEWIDRGLPNPSGKRTDGTGDCLDPDCPVGNLSWYEAAAFANLLSEEHEPPLEPCYELLDCSGGLGEGMVCDGAATTATSLYECEGYRLPTFAEWEYAARAGTRTASYGGDIADAEGACSEEPVLDPIAWYCWNSDGSTHPVGTKDPNAWGLRDILGNVGEWLNDPPFGKSTAGPLTDPGATLIESPMSRIWRGCLFDGHSTLCRAADFQWGTPANHGPGIGFRLVRTLPE